MDKNLTINIDLEKLTKDVLEKETYSEGHSGYAIIENRVKDEIKSNIKNTVVDEIKKSLNLDEFRSSNYGSEYLKREAEEIISESLKYLVKKYAENWVKENIRWVIERQAESSIEKFLVPRLQKMINNLMVVNTESVEKEMQELKDDYENQIRDIENNLDNK